MSPKPTRLQLPGRLLVLASACLTALQGCSAETDAAATAPVKKVRHDPWRESRVSQQWLAAQEGRPTSETWYAFCVDARADGAAPMRRGHAGYRLDLDADRDGLACEPGES